MERAAKQSRYLFSKPGGSMPANRNAISATLLLAVLLLLPVTAAAQSRPDAAATKSLGQLSSSFKAIADAVSPAVVQIVATSYVPALAGGASASSLVTEHSSSGSGVILDPSGYIVTNAHVVDGSQRIQVLLPTPPEESGPQRSILKPLGRILGAQLVGLDSETDLAVLKVTAEDLPYVELGDSDKLRPGEIVLALGSPMGFDNSVSMGIVSAVGRQFKAEDPMVYIQTDAPINPGSSGGPLVNTKGEVVGINTILITHGGGNEGLGFAAPSNIVRNVFGQIRDNGVVRRGVIGVHAQTVTPILAAGLGLTREWGVILGDVYPGSPADKAGLMTADLVLALDDKVMENGRQFDVNLYSRREGDAVKLDIMRGTQRLTITVSVTERRDDSDRFAELVTPDRNLVPRLGILGLDLSREIVKYLPDLRSTTGVVVAARATGAKHWEDGFRLGDVIRSVNRQPIPSLDALRESVAALNSGDAVVAQVERRGTMQYIAFYID
jgi:serine protease Do